MTRPASPLFAAFVALALLAPMTAVGKVKLPPSVAPAPLAFHKSVRGAEASLHLPKAVAAWPALRDSLAQAETAKLNGFLRHAAPPPGKRPPPRERGSWRAIDYELAGVSTRLVSLIRTDESYTGGAHPIHGLSAVIWDKAAKKRLTLAGLFRPGADPAPLDDALCRAVKAAKAEREGSTPLDGQLWKCPAFSQAQAALAPSTVAGKAGGLIVLINPYEVGPYAEGDYRLLISQAEFRRALRPAYGVEFGGELSEAAEALAGSDGTESDRISPAPKPAAKPRPRVEADAPPAAR